MIDLSPSTTLPYLYDHGFAAPGDDLTVEALGWGISNNVMLVRGPTECFVIKQSLPKLRVKDDWPFDQSRIFVERDCMRLLGDLLPPGSVPTVRFSDDANFIFAMSCAPSDGVLWKQALLEGHVDLATATRVGALLADLHNRAARDPRTQTRFGDPTVFIQGRVDPYHWTTARVHPDLAPVIHAEVERMLATHLTLVHGDYSPKNIFAYPDHVLILDFEVAHHGDPAFDAAFCLTHLLLKAHKFPARHRDYLAAAAAVWSAYRDGLDAALAPNIEPNTIRELGCLLLARIDGKSKVEYITDDPTRDRVRHLARAILLGSDRTLTAILALAQQALDQGVS